MINEKCQKDYIVSATASDFHIRAFACTTLNICEESRRLHNTSPVMSAALGRMLSEAQAYIFSNPLTAIFPGIVIVIMILGFSLLGDTIKKN